MPKLTSEPLTHEKFGDKEKIRLVIYQDKHCGVKTWCSQPAILTLGKIPFIAAAIPAILYKNV